MHINFTGKKSGRTGPVGITLPPGYSNANLQQIKYPVIYLLHGYGQKPQDLEAAIAFLKNWMNSPLDGTSSRLPKAILVYVDGRCRPGANGEAECIRGNFFTDSVRADRRAGRDLVARADGLHEPELPHARRDRGRLDRVTIRGVAEFGLERPAAILEYRTQHFEHGEQHSDHKGSTSITEPSASDHRRGQSEHGWTARRNGG